MDTLKGILIKSTGSWYNVLGPDDTIYPSRIKGKFRLIDLKATNPVTIGDRVVFHYDSKLGYSVIDEVLPRSNYLVRKSSNLSKRYHVIAANIDLAVLVLTVSHPRISPGFADRFLVLCEAYQIEPFIIFNKTDLYGKSEEALMEEVSALYNGIGYHTLCVSAKSGEKIDELRSRIIGKTVLLSGQSGVGKSTILNSLAPDMKQKVKELSGYTGKGQHATSFYQMFRIDDNTFCIDSPGLKELSLYDVGDAEISTFFREMREVSHKCRFKSCLHISEPDCAVIKAVEDGTIHSSRYYNYLGILEENMQSK